MRDAAEIVGSGCRRLLRRKPMGRRGGPVQRQDTYAGPAFDLQARIGQENSGVSNTAHILDPLRGLAAIRLKVERNGSYSLKKSGGEQPEQEQPEHEGTCIITVGEGR